MYRIPCREPTYNGMLQTNNVTRIHSHQLKLAALMMFFPQTSWNPSETILMNSLLHPAGESTLALMCISLLCYSLQLQMTCLVTTQFSIPWLSLTVQVATVQSDKTVLIMLEKTLVWDASKSHIIGWTATVRPFLVWCQENIITCVVWSKDLPSFIIENKCNTSVDQISLLHRPQMYLNYVCMPTFFLWNRQSKYSKYGKAATARPEEKFSFGWRDPSNLRTIAINFTWAVKNGHGQPNTLNSLPGVHHTIEQSHIIWSKFAQWPNRVRRTDEQHLNQFKLS